MSWENDDQREDDVRTRQLDDIIERMDHTNKLFQELIHVFKPIPRGYAAWLEQHFIDTVKDGTSAADLRSLYESHITGGST